MSGRNRERFKSESVAKMVKERLAAGWSISRIAKGMGISYIHAKQIVQQVNDGKVEVVR